MEVVRSNRGAAVRTAAAVSVAVGTLTVATWYKSTKRRNNSSNNKSHKDDEDKNLENIILNAFEQASVAQGTAPITTLTWLERKNNNKTTTTPDGSSNSTEDTIQDLIQCRVEEILRHNPWLTGRFVHRKGKGGWTLEYPPDITKEDVDQILYLVDETDSKIHSTRTDMNRLNELLVEDDLVLLFRNDQNQPLWRVALVPENHCKNNNSNSNSNLQSTPTTSSSRVALVESLSHTAGDGHTFYELHNMIMGGTPIRALEVKRLTDTNKLATDAMGGISTEAQMMTNRGFIFSMISGVILTKLIDPLLSAVTGKKRYQASSRFFLVDADKIKAIKKRLRQNSSSESALDGGGGGGGGGVPYVSTNDIITSWYFSNCQNENGLMALNWRGRLAGHTNEHAGNYDGLLYYRLPQDTATPSLIRQSITTTNNNNKSYYRRVVTKAEPIRSIQLARETFALATNWATFISKTINLGDDYHAVAHIPVYNCEEVLPCTLSTCVIFQARPDQVAVLVGGTQKTMAGLSNAPFESDKPIMSLFE